MLGEKHVTKPDSRVMACGMSCRRADIIHSKDVPAVVATSEEGELHRAGSTSCLVRKRWGRSLSTHAVCVLEVGIGSTTGGVSMLQVEGGGR